MLLVGLILIVLNSQIRQPSGHTGLSGWYTTTDRTLNFRSTICSFCPHVQAIFPKRDIFICRSFFKCHMKQYGRCSGCGSVGKAVAFESRRPVIESSHRQNLYLTFTVNGIEKTKIKKKRPGFGPYFNECHMNQNFLPNLFTFEIVLTKRKIGPRRGRKVKNRPKIYHVFVSHQFLGQGQRSIEFIWTRFRQNLLYAFFSQSKLILSTHCGLFL